MRVRYRSAKMALKTRGAGLITLILFVFISFATQDAVAIDRQAELCFETPFGLETKHGQACSTIILEVRDYAEREKAGLNLPKPQEIRND